MKNNNYNFAVQLPTAAQDRNGYYKKGLIKQIEKYPYLTMAGIDNPFETRSGYKIPSVENAGPNDIMTFGSAKNHDISWKTNSEYESNFGEAPVYSIVSEYDAISRRLAKFAESRKPNNYKKDKSEKIGYYVSECPFCGSLATEKVSVYDSFVKVGYTIIPKVIKPVYESVMVTKITISL